MIAIIAGAFVVISLIGLAFAAVDAVRFARRTGHRVPAALTHRAYLV